MGKLLSTILRLFISLPLGVVKIRFFVGSKIEAIFVQFIKNNPLEKYFSLTINNFSSFMLFIVDFIKDKCYEYKQL